MAVEVRREEDSMYMYVSGMYMPWAEVLLTRVMGTNVSHVPVLDSSNESSTPLLTHSMSQTCTPLTHPLTRVMT